MNVETHEGIEQRTEAWHELRRGIPTASNAARLLTPKRLELSTQLDAYAQELAVERFLDQDLEGFAGNAHTRRGELSEEPARDWYRDEALAAGDQILTPGFVYNAELNAGCSPDFIHQTPVEKIGVEIKAQSTKNHFLGVLTDHDGQGTMAQFNLQCQFSMMVTETSQWRILRYHSRLPLVNPVVRSEAICSRLREAIAKVHEKRDAHIATLREIFVAEGKL